MYAIAGAKAVPNLFKSMKRLLLCLAIIATMLFVFSSCAATKRDCQGTKHYKQKGGFYM